MSNTRELLEKYIVSSIDLWPHLKGQDQAMKLNDIMNYIDQYAKQKARDLVYEASDPFYTDAFNKCEKDSASMERYKEWVEFRLKVVKS